MWLASFAKRQRSLMSDVPTKPAAVNNKNALAVGRAFITVIGAGSVQILTQVAGEVGMAQFAQRLFL